MTNIHPKKEKSYGAAILLVTIILLIGSLVYFSFITTNSTLQLKIVSNKNVASEAYNAAHAGVQVALPYLNSNSAAILANPVSGYLAPYSNSSTTNVVLSNGSKYSFTYTNPTASNYSLIKITSTGVSADNVTTRIMSMLVTQVGKGATITAKGNVSMDKHGNWNSFITNLASNMNVITAGTMSMTGNCATITSSGITSTSSTIGSDVQQNVSNFPATEDILFTNTFNTSKATKKSQMAVYYNNTAPNSNYTNLLNGLSGTTIWIDDNRNQFQFNGTLGTPVAPVLLIVMDNLGLSLASAAKIYGFVYVSGGPVKLFANALITGQLVSYASSVYLNGSSITYQNYSSPSIPSSSNYIPVPGSFKDF